MSGIIGSAGTRSGIIGVEINPLQPAFMAYRTLDQSDLAINAWVLFNWTHKSFDQTDSFNTGNYTFTAPVTGKYHFQASVRLENLDSAASYYQVKFNTSNGEFHRNLVRVDEIFNSDVDYFQKDCAVFCHMDAGDTCVTALYQAGGTQQTDLAGSISNSNFSGYLVC